MDDDREKLEHQIELATKAAATIRDEGTVQRLLRFAEELRARLFRSSQHRRISVRARHLWEQAGCPPGRDLEFWLEAEKQVIDEDHRP